MVYFKNISNNWNTIAHRTVERLDDSNELSSLKGRGISLAYTLATPLKALSGLGQLVLTTAQIATITFAVLTLNAHPKHLKQAAANILDVTVGGLLLPVALLAHLIRGVAGTILHPGIMIEHTDALKHDDLWHGTVVVQFKNISHNWNTMTERTVECFDNANEFSSLKGRGISLVHTLATPLKALSGLGKLVLTTAQIATIIFAVLTLNAPPSILKQAGANILDVTVGSILLPVALVAHLIRGAAGTILHPGIMIEQTTVLTEEAHHNLLHGTLVNY